MRVSDEIAPKAVRQLGAERHPLDAFRADGQLQRTVLVVEVVGQHVTGEALARVSVTSTPYVIALLSC